MNSSSFSSACHVFHGGLHGDVDGDVFSAFEGVDGVTQRCGNAFGAVGGLAGVDVGLDGGILPHQWSLPDSTRRKSVPEATRRLISLVPS